MNRWVVLIGFLVLVASKAKSDVQAWMEGAVLDVLKDRDMVSQAVIAIALIAVWLALYPVVIEPEPWCAENGPSEGPH